MRPLSIAVLLVATIGARDAKAEADPVEALKVTWNSLAEPPNQPSPKALEAYHKRVEAAAEKVISPADLCRALPLTSKFATPSEAINKIRSDVRKQLVARTLTTLRASLADKDGSRRLAVVVLIGHTANQERHVSPTDPRERFPLKVKDDEHPVSVLLPLAADLDKAHREEKDVTVRRAMLTALFRLRVKEDLLQTALGRGLKSKDASERQTAARLIGDVFGQKRSQFVKPAEQLGIFGLERHAYRRALAPLLLVGVSDTEAAVRLASLEALSAGVGEMGLDLHLRLAELSSQPIPDVKDEAFSEWANEVARDYAQMTQPAADFERALAVAAKSLEDEDLACRLAAHKALEQAATARFYLRERPRTIALLNGHLTGKKGKEKDDDKGKDDRKLERIEPDKLFPSAVKAVPTLVKSLSHKEVRVRLAALYVLETLTVDAAPAAEALVKALADDDKFVRWGAARALRNLAPAGAAKAVAALAKALEDESPDVRNTAAAALSRYGAEAKASLDALTKALAKGDDRLRLLAARALGAMGTAANAAREPLASALADQKADVRATAATALGKIGPLDEKSKAALVKATEDSDDAVCLAAAEALLATK